MYEITVDSTKPYPNLIICHYPYAVIFFRLQRYILHVKVQKNHVKNTLYSCFFKNEIVRNYVK